MGVRLVWRMKHISANRYALVLAEDNWEERAIWAPGYESHKMGDIVRARWYLTNGFVGDLPEHKLRILDMIKRKAAAELPDFDIYGISNHKEGG